MFGWRADALKRGEVERHDDEAASEVTSGTALGVVEIVINGATIRAGTDIGDGGGRSWATIASLLTTAKMNGVDPHAWLTQTLERIAKGWPNSEIDALMPWNFAG